MESDAKGVFTAVVLFLGALLWLELTVYPFEYGMIESSVLVGLLVLAGLFEFVLDGAVTGE